MQFSGISPYAGPGSPLSHHRHNYLCSLPLGVMHLFARVPALPCSSGLLSTHQTHRTQHLIILYHTTEPDRTAVRHSWAGTNFTVDELQDYTWLKYIGKTGMARKTVNVEKPSFN